MIKSSRTLAEITVVGTDQKGVVAQVTNFIFKAQGNIEKINQNVISGIFGMHCEASFQKEKLSEEGFRVGLKDLGKSLKMEMKILSLLERFNIDFIVLARYMRILTPNFVWRYPNRIINVHPSILPAFPGAFAYAQAYERGAQI